MAKKVKVWVAISPERLDGFARSFRRTVPFSELYEAPQTICGQGVWVGGQYPKTHISLFSTLKILQNTEFRLTSFIDRELGSVDAEKVWGKSVSQNSRKLGLKFLGAWFCVLAAPPGGNRLRRLLGHGRLWYAKKNFGGLRPPVGEILSFK